MAFPSIPLPRSVLIALTVAPLFTAVAAFVPPARHVALRMWGIPEAAHVDSLADRVDSAEAHARNTEKNVKRIICHLDPSLGQTRDCHALGWGIE